METIMNEYGIMAKYYDMFYSNKSYLKEINFIEEIIGTRKNILDLGCGTGIHMQLLESRNFVASGIDLNKAMLDVAKNRVKGTLYEGNILNYQLNKKYDVIISMFAVFNHLSNYDEFEKAILKWYENLYDDGIMIIDLHNGRKSGQKQDIYDSCKRNMKWTFDTVNFKEYTEIIYNINGKIYRGCHEFMIFEINKIVNILSKNNLKYELYENYTFSKANDDSKNIQIVIMKK